MTASRETNERPRARRRVRRVGRSPDFRIEDERVMDAKKVPGVRYSLGDRKIAGSHRAESVARGAQLAAAPF